MQHSTVLLRRGRTKAWQYFHKRCCRDDAHKADQVSEQRCEMLRSRYSSSDSPNTFPVTGFTAWPATAGRAGGSSPPRANAAARACRQSAANGRSPGLQS